MKSVISISIIMFLSFALTSCYYDKEELLYGGGGNCDTATVISYSQKVVPLFQQNCYGCHTGSFPSGNILMGTYTADMVDFETMVICTAIPAFSAESEFSIMARTLRFPEF